MALVTSGVSGGVAVTNQTLGVGLTLAGDYAQVILTNAAPTPGPDTAGLLILVNTGPATTVALQNVVTPAAFAANQWTAYQGAIPLTSGVANTTGAFVLAAGATLNLSLPTVQGLYAVRLLLVPTLTSGQVLVSGQTFPLVTGALNPAVSAYYTQVLATSAALVLALSDMNSTDYLAAVGGSF